MGVALQFSPLGGANSKTTNDLLSVWLNILKGTTKASAVYLFRLNAPSRYVFHPLKIRRAPPPFIWESSSPGVGYGVYQALSKNSVGSACTGHVNVSCQLTG